MSSIRIFLSSCRCFAWILTCISGGGAIALISLYRAAVESTQREREREREREYI